ncbi:hypothetical protein ACLKA7_008166 [Drosophila subpalustris]
MIFPSEKKKELLRYASRNNPATCDAGGTPMPMQRPQQQLPQHQRLPQTSVANCCCCCANDPATMRQLNTPPPPYCLISCSIDYSGSYLQSRQRSATDQQQLIYCTDAEAEADMSVSASASANEDSDYSYIKGGCSYASSGAELLSTENGLCPTPVEEGTVPVYYNAHTHPEPVRLPPTTFAATAANMFRNCCGGGGGGHTTDSSSGSITRTSPLDSRRHVLSRQRTFIPPTNSNTTATTCPIHPHPPTVVNTAGAALRHRTLNQNLNALLKPFKSKQITELLQAVKSRVDPPPKGNWLAMNSAVISSTPSYLQCILIKCTSPLDEDQHVTTCQLFFWSDLRDGRELRRLPLCPSARDYVYTCCNPLHWYRIIQPIDSESAPPPYQRSKMLTDSEGNTQNIERSTGGAWSASNNSNIHSQSISSIIKQGESQLYVPSLESFTTDGKDRSACSKVWCQIAYWELAQRVGEFFHAKKSAVNIYADGPLDGSGESMCLRDLGGKRPPTDAVQNTRQKVGLGVTLSLECGDVWIYNRSNVPIFVDSPTLSERSDRVCKVMPGYCVKAFEIYRAQWLACKQSQHNQLGPIDRFSMKISFAKGWGNTYRRQDVMGCPCWLEVHFNHLR